LDCFHFWNIKVEGYLMMDEIYKSEKKEPKELLNYVIG
jgi:hypothetical protein